MVTKMKMLNTRAASHGAQILLMLSVVASLDSSTLSLAQSAKPASKAAAPQSPRPSEAVGNVIITNKGGVATMDIERGVRTLKRNVQVSQEGEDFIFYADDVTQYEKDNTAVARLNIHIESQDSTIIGDLLQADFNDKMMTLTGNVVMKSHGKGDGLKGKTVRGELLHKASSLTCDRLDYDYETKQATLSGNIRMRQGENFGTCERIVFDEQKNTARLMGNVKFINGDKQTIIGPEVTIWIDSNMIVAPDARAVIPRRANTTGAKKPPRKGIELGDAPTLPQDVLSGGNSKPPPPLAPLSSATPSKATTDSAPAKSETTPTAEPVSSPSAPASTPEKAN
jgi:lipopolysaccharide assembly outer membrane protein LptD (OstA)